jgi:hypothetical protein
MFRLLLLQTPPGRRASRSEVFAIANLGEWEGMRAQDDRSRHLSYRGSTGLDLSCARSLNNRTATTSQQNRMH